MKILVRSVLALALLIVCAPAYAAAADSSLEVVQIWACEMTPGTTEEQVEALAQDWLKAIRKMPGGEAVKMKVFFPAVANSTGQTDFYFVMNTPSFTDWGKIWDAYSDDTVAAKAEDSLNGKVVCPDSMLWEAHEVPAN